MYALAPATVNAVNQPAYDMIMTTILMKRLMMKQVPLRWNSALYTLLKMWSQGWILLVKKLVIACVRGKVSIRTTTFSYNYIMYEQQLLDNNTYTSNIIQFEAHKLCIVYCTLTRVNKEDDHDDESLDYLLYLFLLNLNHSWRMLLENWLLNPCLHEHSHSRFTMRNAMSCTRTC